RIRKAMPSAGLRASKERTQRFERSRGTPRPSASTEKDPVSSTSSSRCIDSAAPRTSYPGPRFADEAGTLTSRRRTVIRLAPLDRAADCLGLRLLRIVPGKYCFDGSPEPRRTLGGIVVVRVGSACITEPQILVEEIDVRGPLGPPGPGHVLALVIDVG